MDFIFWILFGVSLLLNFFLLYMREPLSWKYKNTDGKNALGCPKCDFEISFDAEQPFEKICNAMRFCPGCGQNLIPPSSKKENQ